MQRLDEIVRELLAGVRERIDAEKSGGDANCDRRPRGERVERGSPELEALRRKNRRKRRERKTGASDSPRPGKDAPGGVARGKDTGRDVGRGSAVASHRRREDRDARLPGGELV